MNSETKNINAQEFLQLFRQKKRFVIIITGVFFIVGTILTWRTPKVYRSETLIILNESNDQMAGGGLRGLAGIAGVNLSGNTGSTINPMVFSEVLSSKVFQVELDSKRFYVEGSNDSISLRTFNREFGETSLLSKIISLPGNGIKSILNFLEKKEEPRSGFSLPQDSEQGYMSFSVEDFYFLDGLSNMIEINYDEQRNVVTLACVHQSQEISAQVASFAYSYLHDFVVDYKTSLLHRKLTFIEDQLVDRRSLFDSLQTKLATFRDRNIGPLTNRAQTALDNLQAEYGLAYNYLETFNRQREETRISLEEEKEIFTIIKPVVLPVSHYKPNKKLMIIGYIILGGFIACLWVIGRHFFQEFKSRYL